MEKLAAVLIAAHIIADFLLQTDKIALGKKRWNYRFLHAAIHAALSYLLLQAWGCWQAPLYILPAHSLIDFIKQRFKDDTATVFIIDQIMHILSLLVLAWLLIRWAWVPAFQGIGYKPIITGAGFIATVQGAGYLISLFTKRLIRENDISLDGLSNGGKLIGQLERSLIFMFVFIGQPAGIGFLVAAKSILRFEEAKQQKLAEYILIGSLMSFSIAIALSSATLWALAL